MGRPGPAARKDDAGPPRCRNRESIRFEQAKAEHRVVRVADVQYMTRQGDRLHLDVRVHPLTDGSGELLGAAISFQDVTTARRLQDQLEHTNQQLEAAYEELQSTNEELQSTVEELETMNEELQSTNEDQQSTNEELQHRTGEMHESSAFLEAVLASLRAGVAVVDPEMRVVVWNRRMEDLWGLRSPEATGQHFLNLDIGLPTDRIRPLIRSVLTGRSSQDFVVLSAINRRGRAVELRIVANLLVSRKDTTAGVILVMEPITPTGTEPVPVGTSGDAASTDEAAEA